MSIRQYRNLNEMQMDSVARFGPNKLYGTKTDGQWKWITYSEFGHMVDSCRGGLAKHGIQKGDSVGLISANRVEWAVAGYATYSLGAQYVPMYEHQLEKDWKYIVQDSGIKLLIVSNRSIYDKLKSWPGEVAGLKHVFCMGLDKEDPASWESLLQTGKDNPAPVAEVEPDDICGFIYTSGTTGNPKGVLLSHKNFVSNIAGCTQRFDITSEDLAVSFLPWAHSFGQTAELHFMMSTGCQIAFAEAIDKLVDNFGEVKPTVMVSVPRIFNRIYDGLQKRMEEEGGLKKTLFYAAINNVKKRKELETQGKNSFFVDIKHSILDKLVFSKVRARFGGRLRYAISGGAALSPEVAKFIDNVGIQVYEGYGLTETSPIICCNYPGNRKFGSVGKPLPGYRVEIDTSVMEDKSGDGEIVSFGDNIMKGYHNLPEETQAVLTKDGGFRTGDRGHVDEDGYLYITGRIKEQYKLENGKYVVPAPLEEQLQLSPFIVQVYIDGANKPYNVALVVPDKVAVEKWAAEKGISGSYSDLLKNNAVKQCIRTEIDQYSTDFKGYERIKDFGLIEEEFTTANNMLTPSLKLKRRVVVEKYGEIINQLWSAPE